MPDETTAATLEEVLSHTVYDFLVSEGYHGHYPSAEAQADKYAATYPAAVRSWLAERLADEGLRRSVAEVMAEETAHMVAPTYIAEATAALAAVTAALTEGDGDE